MKVVAIIQARTSSTRFPNKVFSDLSGKPLIWHVVNRLKHSKKIDEIVLATTTNKNDDKLQEWAEQQQLSCFRGSEEDVLNRYYKAANAYNADIVVRITSDDPFKDPEVIDKVIEVLQNKELDFACNNNPPSYPEGLDTEVFTFESIKLADKAAKDNFEREHVTQYFYRNPTLFKMQNIEYGQNISRLRWTIDTIQDYEMVKCIYNALYQQGKIFLLSDILNYLKENPEIGEMNLDVKRSAMYN